jgi:1,2-dihydroxy-3-keto-5-methylthiopentene dioxygenase
MLAYWLNAQECLDLPLAELRRNGIVYESIPVQDPWPHLNRIKAEHGYVAEDLVDLNATRPDFENLGRAFKREHSHEEDEVRFIVSGNGTFDIRSNDDCWMRVWVEPGDLIIIPAGRHHLFHLTSEGIEAIRLFKNEAGWVPSYR